MKTGLIIGQIVISLLVIGLILLQTSPENSNTRVSLVTPKFTRRGIEKFTFILTIFFLLVFLASSFLQLLS